MSYKDRLCSVLLTKARHEKVPAVTIASTGNHGAAAAAYAAAAGLPCVVFTVPQVPAPRRDLYKHQRTNQTPSGQQSLSGRP